MIPKESIRAPDQPCVNEAPERFEPPVNATGKPGLVTAAEIPLWRKLLNLRGLPDSWKRANEADKCGQARN